MCRRFLLSQYCHYCCHVNYLNVSFFCKMFVVFDTECIYVFPNSLIIYGFYYTLMDPWSVCVCVCVCVRMYVCTSMYGLGSSVGLATDYGLEEPRSNPDWDKSFRASILVVRHTKPPVKWVTFLSWGKVRPGRAADQSPPSIAAVIEE